MTSINQMKQIGILSCIKPFPEDSLRCKVATGIVGFFLQSPDFSLREKRLRDKTIFP